MTERARTILLVEDDLDILEEIASFLRRRNFCVVTAPDFDRGQQALADRELELDVVVTDVNLPDGSGLDLLDEINRRPPPPPKPRVIVMSGHLDQGRVQQAHDDGAEAVLLKPFSLSALLQCVRQTEVRQA